MWLHHLQTTTSARGRDDHAGNRENSGVSVKGYFDGDHNALGVDEPFSDKTDETISGIHIIVIQVLSTGTIIIVV